MTNTLPENNHPKLKWWQKGALVGLGLWAITSFLTMTGLRYFLAMMSSKYFFLRAFMLLVSVIELPAFYFTFLANKLLENIIVGSSLTLRIGLVISVQIIGWILVGIVCAFIFHTIRRLTKHFFPVREPTESLQKIQIEKKISIPWKKILIVAALIMVGAIGLHFYETSQRPAPPKELPVAPPIIEEPIIEEGTADWKIYRNGKYGFEIKYPVEVKKEEILYRENEERGFCSVGEDCYTSLFSIGLPYYWEEPPFQKSPFDWSLDLKNYPICYSRFFVQVLEKPPFFSLEELKEKYKKSEYIIIDGVEGLRRNEFRGEPPGGGGNEDVVYLPKNSKLYLVHFIIDREILSKENIGGCIKEQTGIFNKMLSTFRFLEQ